MSSPGAGGSARAVLGSLKDVVTIQKMGTMAMSTTA